MDKSKDFLKNAIDGLGDALGLILAFGVHSLPTERADAIRSALDAKTLDFTFTVDFDADSQQWTAICNLIDGDGVSTVLNLGELANGLSRPALFLVKGSAESTEKS